VPGGEREKTGANFSAKRRPANEVKTDQFASTPVPDPVLRRKAQGRSLMEALDHQFEKMFCDPPADK